MNNNSGSSDEGIQSSLSRFEKNLSDLRTRVQECLPSIPMIKKSKYTMPSRKIIFGFLLFLIALCVIIILFKYQSQWKKNKSKEIYMKYKKYIIGCVGCVIIIGFLWFMKKRYY